MRLLRLTHERPEVTPDVSVRETARIMAGSHIGAIAVRKGATIVGVFSERDLMKRVVAEGRDPVTTRVGEVMNTDIVKVLLSERHLLYDVMNALEAKVGDLTGYIMADSPGG